MSTRAFGQSTLVTSVKIVGLLAAVAGVACQTTDGTSSTSSTAGAAGAEPQAGAGGSAAGGASGSGGVSNSGGAGTNSSGGTDTASGAGGASGGASALGGAGGSGGVMSGGGSGGASGAAGNANLPGCANHAYPVCVDFESGKLDAPWTLGSNNSAGTSAKVETARAAHGQYALHLSGFHMGTSTLIHTTELGSIKDVMWGRYYLYMDPGAPTGHGGMVRAFDEAHDWYELGFEYNGFLGNWHPAAPNPGNWIEKAMRSHDTIPQKKWACVEFLFDGAKPDVTQIWYDGVQVSYYSVISYCTNGTGAAAGCDVTLAKANQFKSFDIGTEYYHGTSLDPNMWGGDGPPTITDAFIDDVALDTTRIGCL